VLKTSLQPYNCRIVYSIYTTWLHIFVIRFVLNCVFISSHIYPCDFDRDYADAIYMLQLHFCIVCIKTAQHTVLHIVYKAKICSIVSTCIPMKKTEDCVSHALLSWCFENLYNKKWQNLCLQFSFSLIIGINLKIEPVKKMTRHLVAPTYVVDTVGV